MRIDERSLDQLLPPEHVARLVWDYVGGLDLTPFFQSDSNLASRIRDAAFAPMARLPYIRREMVRTLAGLKTGLFTHQTPNGLVGTSALEPAATVHKPAGLT